MPEVYSIGLSPHFGPHSPIYARTSIELCLYVPDKGMLHQSGLPWSKGEVSPIHRSSLLANKVRLDPIRTCLSFFQMVLRTYAQYQIQLRGGAPDLGVRRGVACVRCVGRQSLCITMIPGEYRINCISCSILRYSGYYIGEAVPSACIGEGDC